MPRWGANDGLHTCRECGEEYGYAVRRDDLGRKGQRVQDKINFCQEFLRDYGVTAMGARAFDYASEVMGVA